MKKYLSAFVAGFGAGVMQIVPVAKSFSCCLIMPVASYFAIILDRKSKNETGFVVTRTGVTIGLLTGLYAAIFGTVFDLLITLITKSNDLVASLPEIQKMFADFPLSDALKNEVAQLINSVANQIQLTGFSWLYTFSVIVNNFSVNIIFGIIGGLVSVQIINSKIKRDQI